LEFLVFYLHSCLTHFHGLIFQLVLIVTLIVLNMKRSLQKFLPIKLLMTHCTVAVESTSQEVALVLFIAIMLHLHGCILPEIQVNFHHYLHCYMVSSRRKTSESSFFLLRCWGGFDNIDILGLEEIVEDHETGVLLLYMPLFRIYAL